MPASADWWSPEITRRFAAALPNILPTSGAWVSLPWLINKTRHLLTEAQASTNYKRHIEARPAPTQKQTTFEERCALGRKWMLFDAMRTHTKNKVIEWNGDDSDEGRRYRRVVTCPFTDEFKDARTGDGEIVFIPLADLRIDGDTQVRAGAIDMIHAQRFADSYRAGREVPPVLAVKDETSIWLADGFHRRKGAELAGLEMIECELRLGTLKQARIIAAASNKEGETNTKARTLEDRKLAAMLLIRETNWSNPLIAQWVASINDDRELSDNTIEALRKIVKKEPKSQVEGSQTANLPPEKRTGKDGKQYPATRKPSNSTEKKQRAKQVQQKVKVEKKSIRAAAKEMGITHTQARDDLAAAEEADKEEELQTKHADPPASEPVAYVAVESPGLVALRNAWEGSPIMQEAWTKASIEDRQTFLAEIQGGPV